jgi:Fur family transcriptional regulator, peroxide stress response regulator
MDTKIPSQITFDDFREFCNSAKLKPTHQRFEIYRELNSATDHPSAEMLYQRVKTNVPSVSLETVYRTLATFEQHGIIVRINAFGDRARFDANLTVHQHLACTNCLAICDFTWTAFEKLELPAQTGNWGRIESQQVVVKGLCNSCLEKESSA